MDKLNFETTFNLYLFKTDKKSASSSHLNEFMAFLKTHYSSQSYKFSYVGISDALLPELTLNQNLLMDFTPNSLTDSKEHQFQEFLKNSTNPFLLKLYNKISLINELPSNSDTQMKKICSLLKSLIYEGEFIFLESPEDQLEIECFEIFIEALKIHMHEKKINVFIYSDNPTNWIKHSSFLVKRNENFSFNVQELDANNSFLNKREEFYKSIHLTNEKMANKLEFHLPNKLLLNKKKNSAA